MSIKDEIKEFIEQTELSRTGLLTVKKDARVPKTFVLDLIKALPVGMFEHPKLKFLQSLYKSNPAKDYVLLSKEYLAEFLETL